MKKRILGLMMAATMIVAVTSACAPAVEAPAAEAPAAEAPAAEEPAAEAPTAETPAEEPAASGGSATMEKVIGVSLPHMSSPARVAMATEIEAAVEAIGQGNWEVIITDGQTNNAKQTSDVEDLIQRGVDAMIMCPNAADPLVPAAQSVMNAGIPLVLIDRTISTEDFTVYTGGDNYMIGQMAAEYIAEQTNGVANVAIIQGAPGGSATNDRQAGFIDTITEKYPDIKVVADVNGEWKRDVGMKVMEDIIQAQGDEIDAVYSHGDNATLGALQAMEAAGKEYIVVTADGQKEIFDAIKEGKVGACIAFPGGGKEAVALIEQIFDGEDIGEKIQMIPVPIITIDNVDEMYSIGY